MPRAQTMSDVARAAGVSPMTVSNVVNGRPGVSESVRRRVLEHIQASGYRMNAAARNLRAGRSGVIGLAVPELDRSYYGQLGALIAAAARRRGFRVAVEETRAGEAGEMAAIELSQALQYDGLILASVGMDLAKIAGRDPAAGSALPIVLLGERSSPAGLDHIALPNEAGARLAAEHLFEQGARRIAFVGGPIPKDASIRSLRMSGYAAALEANGQALDSDLIIDVEEISMAAGRSAGRRVAQMLTTSAPNSSGRWAQVDGILAITDTVAMGVIRGLRDHGLGVPDDLLVAGFDDIPEAEYLSPSLTTVRPDHHWTAQHAVDLLIAQMTGGQIPGGEHVAPHQLMRRESTRC